MALEHGGAGLDGDVDQGVVELQAGGDGGVGAGALRQRHAHLPARRRAQDRAVDDLPVGDRRRVEPELLELAQGQRRQPVATALVAGEHRLVGDDDVAPGGGERHGGGDPGRPRPDDEHVRHQHRRPGYGPLHPSRSAAVECVVRGQAGTHVLGLDTTYSDWKCMVRRMTRLCEGRVAIVTGAGRGIGREHALSLARHGAKVVVNDLGGDMHGGGADTSPAQQVVDEIKAAGGEAVANGESVSDFEGAGRLIQTAIDTFGDLHVLVNNAGILRDRVIANMTEEEWDAVINVHLKGTFAPSRWAVAHWREQAKAGNPVSGRIINTTSVSGIYGNPGQSNYGAAKMGIAAFTNIVALEVARYGVTVNAVAPVALTRMTEGLGPAPETDEEREARAPHWIAPIVTWLASEEAAGVTGRVFEASGQFLAVAEGWTRGPSTDPLDDPTKLGDVVAKLLADARANSGMDGKPGSWPQTQLSPKQ